MTATARKNTKIKSKMLGVRLTDGELAYFKTCAVNADKTASELAREYLNEILSGAEKVAEKTARKWLSF